MCVGECIKKWLYKVTTVVFFGSTVLFLILYIMEKNVSVNLWVNLPNPHGSLFKLLVPTLHYLFLELRRQQPPPLRDWNEPKVQSKCAWWHCFRRVETWLLETSIRDFSPNLENKLIVTQLVVTSFLLLFRQRSLAAKETTNFSVVLLTVFYKSNWGHVR